MLFKVASALTTWKFFFPEFGCPFSQIRRGWELRESKPFLLCFISN